MGSLVRFPNKTYTQRIGNDTVYGGGFDGNVVISSNTSLSRDMYYNNLTINTGVHLNTNGFRVFVRGTLILNGSIGVKNDISVSSGTVSGNVTSSGSSVTYSIGGAGSGTTATQIPASLLNDVQSAISGAYRDSSGILRALAGGSSGTKGNDGTLTPGTDSPATWPNSAGVAGALGQHPPHAHSVGVQGGRGASGTPGTRGSLASPGTAGVGGAGGAGGPVVLVVAKNVSGSGTFFSQGRAGLVKTAAVAPGAVSAGSAGTAGDAAPARDGGSVHVNTYHHTRPAHHGGGDHHTTPLPTTYFPSDNAWLGPHSPIVHGRPEGWHQTRLWNYEEHYNNTIGGGSFYFAGDAHDHGHVDNYHAPGGHFYHIGGVNHNHFSADGPAGGRPAGHHAYLFFYDSIFNRSPATHSSGDYSSHHSVPKQAERDLKLQAGPVAHSHSYTFHYPGGAGGAAGTAGPAGTAGSVTEGVDGKPGGGGGFILVTENSISGPSINTNGGTSDSSTGSAGMQVIILNT